jgi:hypothetical protein
MSTLDPREAALATIVDATFETVKLEELQTMRADAFDRLPFGVCSRRGWGQDAHSLATGLRHSVDRCSPCGPRWGT